MAETNLTASVRDETGKQAAKHLRAQGMVPGILYGPGIEPANLTFDKKDLLTQLHKYGRNTVFNLSFGKTKDIKSFIYDIQHDPLTGDLVHVDFKQISMDKMIDVSVPVRLNGIAYGVKNEGGIVDHMLHTLEISCLPISIPNEIAIDISEMKLGDVLHVSDLPSEDYEVLSEQDTAIVHIVSPKIVSEDEEGEEGEGLLAGDEAAAEPEVIGGSKEEE